MKLSLLSIIGIIMIALATPAMACDDGPRCMMCPDVDLGPVYGSAKDMGALAMLNPMLDPTTDSVQIAIDASNFENRNAVGVSIGIPLIEEKLFLHGSFSQVLETDVKGTSMGITYSF